MGNSRNLPPLTPSGIFAPALDSRDSDTVLISRTIRAYPPLASLCSTFHLTAFGIG
jgi:hypothetical protein